MCYLISSQVESQTFVLFSSRADLLKSRLDLRLVLFADLFSLDQVLLSRVILLVWVFADSVVFVDSLDFDTLVFLASLASVFLTLLASVFLVSLASVFLVSLASVFLVSLASVFLASLSSFFLALLSSVSLSLIFSALSIFASLVVFLALISSYSSSLVLASLALASLALAF